MANLDGFQISGSEFFGKSIVYPAAYDLNGDGLTDIVYMTGTFPPDTEVAYSPLILMNEGGGEFSPVELPDNPGLVHPREIVFDDFNGDSFIDFFIVGHGYDTNPFPGENNLLFLSDGSGGYESAVDKTPFVNDFSHSVTSADVDGDGDQDIYVGNIYGQSNVDPYVLLNDGRGQFKTLELSGEQFTLDTNVSTSSQLVDMDADAIPELVLGHYNGSPARIVHFDPSSLELTSVDYLPDALFGDQTVTVDVLPIDLNGDARLDLVLSETLDYEKTGLQVLIQEPDGTYSDQTNVFFEDFDQDQAWISFLAAIDVNGDGLDDLVTTQTPKDGPTAYINTGGHFVPVTREFTIDHSEWFELAIDGVGGGVVATEEYDGVFTVAEIPLNLLGASVSIKGLDGIHRIGTGADEVMTGAMARDTLKGKAGKDVLIGLGSADKLFGGGGGDILRGGSGGDRLAGGKGYDRVNGGGGHDRLIGGSGDDRLGGGRGNDRMIGGNGDDRLIGGKGADKFIFRNGFGNDTIVNFNTNNGREDIKLAGVRSIKNFSDLTNNHLSDDANGNALIDDGRGNTITILGVSSSDLDASDFIF